MHLTNRCEYALLALLWMARKAHGRLFHAEEIADAQQIPLRFLQQILATLKRARIVKAIKGKSGGYALARPAKDISIAEIVRLFEGPLAPTKSVSKYFYAATPIEKERKILQLLKELREFVSDRLENTSLADLA